MKKLVDGGPGKRRRGERDWRKRRRRKGKMR